MQTGSYGSLRTSIESSGSNQAASHHQDMQDLSLMPQSQHAGSADHHGDSMQNVSQQPGVPSAAEAQAMQQLKVSQRAVQECSMHQAPDKLGWRPLHACLLGSNAACESVADHRGAALGCKEGPWDGYLRCWGTHLPPCTLQPPSGRQTSPFHRQPASMSSEAITQSASTAPGSMPYKPPYRGNALRPPDCPEDCYQECP